jgi:hypothetical protein
VQTQAEPAILQIQTLGTSGNHAISNEPVDPCHGTIATGNEIVAFSGGPQAKSILAKARQMQKEFNQTSSSRLPNSNTVVQWSNLTSTSSWQQQTSVLLTANNIRDKTSMRHTILCVSTTGSSSNSTPKTAAQSQSVLQQQSMQFPRH